MPRQIRLFTQSICRPPTARRSALATTGLSAALLLLSACATFEEGEEVAYKPLIDATFSARSEPARTTNESEEALARKGYEKIGTVRAQLISQRCDENSSCQPVPGEVDSTAVALQRAAREGGDLVRLLENNVVGSEPRTKKVCNGWGSTYVSQYYCPSSGGGSCYNRDVLQRVCTGWDSVTIGSIVTRRSHGSVWRHDPERAKTTGFFAAVARGDRAFVQAGLAQGSSARATDAQGRLPLVVAAERGHLTVVKLLVESGADINGADKSGTPLNVAVAGGRIDAARLLLARGANANLKDGSGATALHTAIEGGHIEIVKALLAHGANVNGKDAGGIAPLHLAIGKGDAVSAKVLLAHGADTNATSQDWKPMMFAAVKGRAEIVKTLLARGAETDEGFEDGTPLMAAASHRHPEIVRVLLAHGADVNAVDKRGQTALTLSAASNVPDIVKLLLAAGADINARPNDGRTALLVAATWGYTATAQALLAGGADANVRDKDGKTALARAVHMGHSTIVDLLREAGARE